MQPDKSSIDPAVAQEAQGMFLQAAALMQKGQAEKALSLYQTVLLHDPSHAFAWSNMGLILREAKRYGPALLCAGRALELDPDSPVFLSNYGGALAALDRKEEALKASRLAAEKAPDHVKILTQHAITLREMGEAREAAPYFDKACALSPDDADLHWERAINNLVLCRFDEGWKGFEYRWKIGKISLHDYDGVPRWQGEDLSGKTILVYEEQGYGDTLLCARYLPLLKERGARVIVECTPPLLRLMQTVKGVDAVVARGADAGGKPDYQTPVMSLPGLFRTTLENIPAPAAVRVTAAVPPEAARLLALGGNRLKVGIVWSGRTSFAQNHKRAVPLQRFFPLAEVPGVQLYSLQKGVGDEQVSTGALRGIIYALGPHIKDFAETAAILRGLDLVIMTDSGVAHLAGAMGVPVWNLLCYRPYWLYMQDREDSPWYPSMRLIRQNAPGDWDDVFKRATEALTQLASSRG